MSAVGSGQKPGASKACVRRLTRAPRSGAHLLCWGVAQHATGRRVLAVEALPAMGPPPTLPLAVWRRLRLAVPGIFSSACAFAFSSAFSAASASARFCFSSRMLLLGASCLLVLSLSPVWVGKRCLGLLFPASCYLLPSSCHLSSRCLPRDAACLRLLARCLPRDATCVACPETPRALPAQRRDETR